MVSCRTTRQSHRGCAVGVARYMDASAGNSFPLCGCIEAVLADDYEARAAHVAIAALIGQFGGFDDGLRMRFTPFVRPRLFNWNGVETGFLRPAGAPA